jgi:class 3 adenylate cyclase
LLDEVQAFFTGVRGTADVDRVLSTVLFTDLVASTERAAELGDRRWREILDRHDAIVRSHVEHFRGRLIKTTGDGVLATFDGPARAIRCARAISEEVRGLGVEVRAGLHTGEVELRGEDIGGIAVALAARVMAKAGPSEELVSSTVKDLVVGSGIEFEDRGAHELKGVPGEWRLYAVRS